MKTIRINDEEYIKKKEYDKLKEKKIKIVKEDIHFNDIAIPDNCFACGLIRLSEFSNKVLKEKGLEFNKTFTDKLEFLESQTEEFNEYPRVRINKTTYNFEYFIKAINIAKTLGIDETYKIKINNEKDKPLLLDFGSFGFMIAPRVESEDLEEKE